MENNENVVKFLKKYGWIILLIMIFLAALYIRSLPGLKLQEPRLQAIDPYYFFRMGEYIIENGHLPTDDGMAGWGTIPGGPDRTQDFLVVLWIYPMLYFILNPLLGVSWYWVGVWGPALFGALQVIFIFFLAKELFNSRKIGLMSAMFLSFLPGILYRVSAGFIEKEPVAGGMMILGMYFFVKAFKQYEISKDFSWHRLLIHPVSTLIGKIKKEDETLMIIKTAIYGIIAGFTFAMMAGTWGGVRIALLIIGVFVVISLLLDRYPKALLFAHIPMLITFFIFSRAFAVSPNITDIEFLSNIVAAGLLFIRYFSEKFKIVEEKYLPYIIPAIFVIGLFIFGIVAYVNVEIGSWTAFYIERISSPMTSGVIPSTVAESQSAGNFLRNTLSTFGTEYAVRSYGLPPFMVYLSTIYFAALGILLMGYEFVMKKRNLEHIFIMLFFVAGMLLATGAMRLTFVFGYPVAIAAGYFIIRGGSYVMLYTKKLLNEKGRHYLKIIGTVFVAIVVITNFSAGVVMGNSINSSLSDDWYNSLIWLKENTAKDAVILEWWDFGWWFQYVGEKITLVDGGYHDQKPTQDIAKFYTEPLTDDGLNFLKKFGVDYVMVSPDLIPKFGAMSKIANWGTKVDVLPTFNMVNSYQEGDKTLLEYSGGGQTVLVAYSVSGEGNSTTLSNITAMIKSPQGQAFVRDVGVGNQVIRNDRPNSIPGMIYFAGNVVIFAPEAVEDCMFVRLYLFDGVGLEPYFNKVYDEQGMKIYEVLYENFSPEITGDYILAGDR